MSFIELINLDKRYSAKGNLIVNQMNLKIEQGEFIVFLGPSGCGKTTTIRMISGLEDISGGDITVNGSSIVSLAPKDRGVSMIFQSYAVWPHMTVYENIAYPLRLKHMKKDERDIKVKLAADKTNIGDYLQRYPSQLSGGQRQRVAVARAMVVEPKIFLMDEPLSNLDAMLRVSMRSELKNIHETLKATTIFVTHDQAEAMSLADRIVIMKDGLIQQIGTPKQVYYDCETVFVASFIGTPPANFFKVHLEEIKDQIHAKNELVDYILNAEEKHLVKDYLNQDVIMGIRPENIEIHTQEKITEGLLFEAKADFVEPQGSHIIVIINQNNNIVKVSSPLLDLEPKTKIYLNVKEHRVMFFDPTTEKRIRKV